MSINQRGEKRDCASSLSYFQLRSTEILQQRPKKPLKCQNKPVQQILISFILGEWF